MAADYQNQLLRGHVSRMHQLLRESVFELKRDVYQAKQEISCSRDKIGQEINYYCERYIGIEKHASQEMKPLSSHEVKQEAKASRHSQKPPTKGKKTVKKPKLENAKQK